ncbi:helix-turn-helix domain-containing protein [Methylobacterium planeticum]|uniref:Helix-turn-helix transcriptional regulator n=1 Tax=Methylobacterium planeticum TaxID=2615211 RepID=A0A6N6MR13_9HYPH|nr:helix-turn-helix domain-containing protein [Methylobacterium planeticum]KAB1072641.1 helix-turn-helix transcriptional regulator [Methylobacterium planeticum]
MASTPPARNAKQTTTADHSIGMRIAELRIAKGISQAALGQAIGVSFQQVQKYERGLNRVGAARLQSIAGLLNVPVSTFLPDQAGAVRAEDTSLSLLRAPEALELVQAFSSITDAQIRRDVLSIVKSAARLHAPDCDVS